jgi:putative hydrolase of the HAD superfamily
MIVDFANIDAVTLDFYNTLVYHKHGSGRGAMLMEYLRAQQLECDPWEHQVLYDVFERHATDYSPHLTAEEKQRYLLWFTDRVFQRLNVRAPDGEAADHVDQVWRVLGPTSLGVFPEVPRVLKLLRAARYRLSLISNWQCGLQHFCHELGFAGAMDHIVASAEVGIAKPDPDIFVDVCSRMEVLCHRVLHVGDSIVDDIEGARSAGMQAVLVQRDEVVLLRDTRSISSLAQLPELLGLRNEARGTGGEHGANS